MRKIQAFIIMNGVGRWFIVAKISIYGFDSYAKKLKNLSDQIVKIEGDAIYNAADVVADEVRKGIHWINPGSSSGNESEYEYQRRVKQIEGLEKSFGIAELRDDNGFKNVKLGFEGYNDVKTKKHPNGQPNPMIARVFNSGTSFSSKQPFFDIAIRNSRNRATKVMKETVENEIDNVMKG